MSIYKSFIGQYPEYKSRLYTIGALAWMILHSGEGVIPDLPKEQRGKSLEEIYHEVDTGYQNEWSKK